MLFYEIISCDERDDGDYNITFSLWTKDRVLGIELEEIYKQLKDICKRDGDSFVFDQKQIRFTDACLCISNLSYMYDKTEVVLLFDDSIPRSIQYKMQQMAYFYYKIGDDEDDN